MSKTTGNVIDPVEQKEKWGLSPLKYYLTFGLSLYDDSKYSEKELVNLWNSEIVNGLGNLISRTLHLIDIKNITPDESLLPISLKEELDLFKINIEESFEKYDFISVKNYLNNSITKLNKRFQNERPFDKDCSNYKEILNEIYFELKTISLYYSIILKEYKDVIERAFIENKKTILFKPLEL